MSATRPPEAALATTATFTYGYATLALLIALGPALTLAARRGAAPGAVAERPGER
ncbi:hypothetical protein IM697_43820 [Streptomyces ferrugineus]|uniref:Uncharacterized protein n=1 Tax=Streptomyces ferrugineus TaxID=1413221 RepID=A0A7M2SMW9_9ACTN|nr:hypothetical protein [Streptomyces ferrugineus]QOV36808.1 hypothetical protein IM697_43820 [Streptomyces ferrugineus]